MSQPLSEGALHLLAIDLPLACVLVTPLLLAANSLRKDSTPALIVPAVVLIVLGTSSLGAALLETRSASDVLLNGPAAAEIREHQHSLALFAMSTFASAALLFATGLMAWRTVVSRMRPKSLSLASVVFGLVYVFASAWLILAAHRGAVLADHLARHTSSW